MDDARSLLILARGCGSARALRTLLDRFGDPDAALRARVGDWREAGVASERIARLQRPDAGRLRSDLAWLADSRHFLLGWHSPDYPALLRNIGNPPAVLFGAGDPTLLWHPQIAIVGSRRPSAGGRAHAHRFAAAFGDSQFVVTSGLAEGIDTAAHSGALSCYRTLAVIATGPDSVFPACNAGLSARIVENGALISEHPPGTPPRREHFPSRNRLIAGLALGTVVVEAALRSGALITARLAAEAGREVFALPGSIDNPMARGCHRLLRQGAGLAESPEEIIESFAPVAAGLAQALRQRLQEPCRATSLPEPCATDSSLPKPAPLIEGDAPRQLWQALGHDPVTLDQLAERTGLTVAALSAMLLAMELDGRVGAEHGRYTRRT